MTVPQLAGERWLPAVLLISICGCGSGNATVSGKITYQHRPVTYGSVTFLGSDEKAGSAAINPDGSYTVEGLTPGPMHIGVTSRDPNKGRPPRKAESKGDTEKQSPASGWFPLPRHYEAALNSGLGCTLKAGANTHDIDLE